MTAVTARAVVNNNNTSENSSIASSTKAAELSMGSLLAKKVVTGSFGGIVQAVCSHPFDLVKSRVQSGVYPNMRTTVAETFRKEGALAFYKGVSPPIAIAGTYNAVLFVSNEAAKNFLIYACDLEKDKPLPMKYTMVAAVLSAPTTVAVIAPADVVKIQLQMQREGKGKAQYSGMLDCIVKMWKNEGFSSLSRGYFPTLMTRIVGLPGFFGGNQIGKDVWRSYFPESSDFTTALVGGSVAGISFWTLCYPFDLIKTKLQSQVSASGMQKKTAMQIGREIYQARGIAGFYLGFGACFVRAIPACSSVFAGIDIADKFLKRNFDW